MPTTATIPVTIEPAAAAFLAEIGMERELNMMLDHAKATIPHLFALDVGLHVFPETGPPSPTIHAHRERCSGRPDRTWMEFGEWTRTTFRPEVLQNRLRFVYGGNPYAQEFGRRLDVLVKIRNEADYKLASPGSFRNASEPAVAINDAAFDQERGSRSIGNQTNSRIASPLSTSRIGWPSGVSNWLVGSMPSLV